MKIAGAFILFLFFYLRTPATFGQQAPQAVLFSKGEFITGSNIKNRAFKKEALASASFEQQYYVLIQFSEIPSQKIQNSLSKVGIFLHSYLPGKAYLATINAGFNFETAANFNISSVNIVPAFYKIDARLDDYKIATDKENLKLVAVSFYPTISKAMVQEQLRLTGAFIQSTKFDNSNIIFIQATNKVIHAIAELPFISEIHLQSITDKTLNYNDIGAHGISGLNALNGKNLNGKGITIGIGDNADISTHIDISGRLINRSPGTPADHGTHVAGTAAGAGIINIKNHGMAPKATLINQYFSDIIVNAPTYITDYNMVVTNNSYYSVEVGCPGSGEYDVLSNYIDQQLGKYNQLLHVIAAGNDGTYTCSPMPASYGTVKSGWQCAKNVLTVGNFNTNDYTITYTSSRGPVKDGRIKPEIVAGGFGITSTFTNNTYGLNSGTSMSSPVVTGSLALMVERYRQLHTGANPPAALMKALACNTAEDLGNAGPDFTFGFGMLNARRAVEAIEGNRYFINTISNGGNTAHTITVPANTQRIKIMLYWADTAAAINAAATLVNDLDLTVTGPSAQVHHPLILNPLPGNLNDIAVEGTDHINNIEQVVIENPGAGNYTININGYTVPLGSQQYIISYEIVQPSVIVEYPFGGEKLVPGEIENIRWSAYGNESNNFTIEYSVDNGSSWLLIDNNVPAASRKYAWTMPAGLITNQALVRVSRNGTALSDQSDFNFTLLGSPSITATNVCEGAIQLDWPAVSGATSYDILQLSGDSMQVIGNTTGLTYLVTGLNKTVKAWLAVTAKNGVVAGRRSIAAGNIPTTGTCTLASFNNDLKVDSILEPTTARQGFANAGNAVKPVKIAIRNLASVAVSGPMSVSYRYANTTVTESIDPTIAAGGTYTYTFTGLYPIVPAGFKYDFKAWVTLAADANHLNDTAYKTVRYINNDAIVSMPVTDGFESLAAAEFTVPEMAIGDNKRLDFSASTIRGRARSFVNTGFAYTGNRAITLDQSPYNNIANADSLSFSYNLSNFTAKQLRLDFFYKNHGQLNAGGNRVWIRGNENNAWVEAYNLFSNQAVLSAWKRAIININEVLGSATPAQTAGATFQVKIGQEGNTSANTANAVVDIDDGYTIDDVTLTEVSNDMGVVKIISPDGSDCSLGASTAISIQIKNYNNSTLTNFPVSYRINGGTIVTENISSIGPNQSMDYVFNQTANLAAFIDYNINVWVKNPGDNYAVNDSILNFSIHNSPVISVFPYLQNFESSNGNFYTKGTGTSWQWGTPVKPIIGKSASGVKAWATSLAGNYNDNETSYLYSPCFDLTGLSQPVLSFSHIFMLEPNYDYSWVEYSTDGVAWQKLGAFGSGTNWYNDVSETAWGGGNARWHVSSIDLPVPVSTIRFRFILSSDAGVSDEGIGIDDVHIFDKAVIYTGNPVTGITQTVNSNGWTHFSSGGKRIVSLNSNGANLGPTTVQVHPYSGAIRNSNGAYYIDRNIVVSPANPPSANVGIRFYFTEAEAANLMNAVSCTSCLIPVDVYQLGITKYSGKAADENGLLDDDVTGLFKYILPANTTVVPYDNGYYAEFNVNSFSEFWLSVASIKPAANGICPGENMVLNSAVAGTNYQWQEDKGSGFANINDGPLYSGTHTVSLQLINLASSYSGYKYRCVVNGANGNSTTVRFTNSWTGATSSNWFTSSNWSCGTVPDQYTDAIIPGGIANNPVITASTAIKSISVHPGSIVTLAPSVILQVNGK